MENITPKWLMAGIILVSVFGSFLFLNYYNKQPDEVFNYNNQFIDVNSFLKLSKPEPLVDAIVGKVEKIKILEMKFLFFGDMMLDRNVGDKLKDKNIDYLLANLAGVENEFFSGFDIIGTNLEGAVTDSGAHYNPINSYDFAFSPERINELKKYGFNYFTLANNHFSDQGQKGVEETRKNLSSLEFNYSGATDAQIDEYSRKDIIVSGRKVAMVGLSMVYNNFDLEVAKKLIAEANLETELVIVNIHWGVEYQHQFNKHQQDIGRALIDSGAGAIIGHHPHVVQGMEIYNGKPIFYSLGNFIFDQYFSVETQESLAVSLSFSESTTTISIFPLKSEKSAPRLMTTQEKEAFLNKFISWSEVGGDIETQIKNQLISTPRIIE